MREQEVPEIYDVQNRIHHQDSSFSGINTHYYRKVILREEFLNHIKMLET